MSSLLGCRGRSVSSSGKLGRAYAKPEMIGERYWGREFEGLKKRMLWEPRPLWSQSTE